MASAEKLDLYKVYKADYVASKKPVLVRIKAASYLTVDGSGAPGGEVFTSKLGCLYNVAFTVKMTKKFAGRDYAVCKLEGLWWGRSKQEQFYLDPASTWRWKLMIRVPDFIKLKDVNAAIEHLTQRGKEAAVAEVGLEKIDEGQCIQMLHVGPYSKENETIAEMMKLADNEGLKFEGLHHEIYLSDPRRVPAERLRTILRHPVKPRR